MEMLKKIFPVSFKKKKDLAALIIDLLIYIVAGVVIGFVMGLLAKIPLVGLVFRLAGWLLEIYFFAGIVLSVLDYLKVLK